MIPGITVVCMIIKFDRPGQSGSEKNFLTNNSSFPNYSHLNDHTKRTKEPVQDMILRMLDVIVVLVTDSLTLYDAIQCPEVVPEDVVPQLNPPD